MQECNTNKNSTFWKSLIKFFQHSYNKVTSILQLVALSISWNLDGTPSFRITQGITRWIWSIYLAQSSLVKDSQNCRIPFTSSSFLFGLTTLNRKFFSVEFSIGFISGDEAGVSVTLSNIHCSSIHFLVDLLTCLLSISYKKLIQW